MFQLTTGLFRALEKAFLDDIQAVKTSDTLGEVLIVSPSGHLLTHLQHELAGKGAYLNVHFLTFYALAERLLSDGPLPEDCVVSEPALFREIIHDFLIGQERIPYQSREALLRQGAPIPKGLPGALASTLKDLQDSGARVVDCANVAREGHLGDALEGAIPILELNVLMYDVLRKHGLRTNADFLRRAAERAAAHPWIRRQKAIYLYGFYDLTGIQLDLVRALMKHPAAKIYFPYEEGNPAYDYAQKLLDDLSLHSVVRGTRASQAHDAVTPRVPLTTPLTEAWSCSGTQNEVWWTAKKILEQADAGVPFHKMAILARTLEPYLNDLRQLLEAHRIPYALHAEEPVGAYPLIKMARQLLSSGLRAQNSEMWSVHVAWAKQRLADGIRLPKDADATEKRLWDGLMDAIERLGELDRLGRAVSRERFLEVLEEKLEGLRLPLAPDNVAGVQVMDVMTARGLSFESVFLLGLNEKLFPRLIREDPFLSDQARSALSSALGSRLGRKMDGFQEEKLLFELATTSAGKHLHLSCQRSDEEGKALVVSLYLLDYLKTHQIKLAAVPRAWPERIQKATPTTLTPKEVSIAFHRENKEPSELYKALGWDWNHLSHLLQAQKEIESFGRLGDHDGLIGKNHPLAKAILGEGLSPNTLKDLAECPFKVYARKVLDLYTSEPDVEAGQLTHTGRGKLIHKILQTFYQTDSKLAYLVSIADEESKVFGAEYSDLYPLAWEAEKAHIMALLNRFIPLDLADQAATGFKPTYFETPMAGELAGVQLQGRVDRLDIGPQGCRVVDYKTGSGGIKKGEKVETAIMKGKSFQLPVYLALAQTYLESQKNPAAKQGSAVFYRLEDEEVVDAPIEIGPSFWEKHGSRFYENLAFLVKNIEAGSFYIRPSGPHGHCDWCHYAAICRKEHKPTQIRSERSPSRNSHEEVFSGGKGK